jgi:peptidoglycan/xylan/chitin deacetylase (PgdA/CDA1 family)
MYWRADTDKGSAPQFRMQPTAGASVGKRMTLSGAQYCAQIKQSADRLQVLTQQPALPLFRAPGGKTSATLLAVARSCGYAHVAWADAGFLGDELPSDKYSNQALLKKALRDVRSGDILVAHLGIWSRKEPWAPAVLEPLIVGLQAKGFCFETLRTHPAYQGWIAQHKG